MFLLKNLSVEVLVIYFKEMPMYFVYSRNGLRLLQKWIITHFLNGSQIPFSTSSVRTSPYFCKAICAFIVGD